MIKSPILWGTALACAFGGAVAGNAFGSAPILDRSALDAFYQDHATAYEEASSAEALPNHYPLVTPDGTVPVAALSDRGLYSQHRYRAVALAEEYTPADAEALSVYQPAADEHVPQREGFSFDERQPVDNPPTVAQPAIGRPLALDEPATVRGSGNAKTIMVTLALAEE